MNFLIEKVSWLPYKTLYNFSKVPKNPFVLSLKKVDIPEKITFHYISNDKGLSKQFGLYGFREPLNWKNYYEFVNKNDIVIDIGANIGLFSILSKNAKKIICVEPIKECIPILKKNLHSNGLHNKSIVLNMAVGKRGKLYLKKEGHINLSKIVDKKGKGVQEIKSENLKYFDKKYSPNVLRMDVEGYEFEILKEGIPRKINKISMEFHTSLMGKEKSIELLKILEKKGFKVSKLVEDLPLRLYPFYNLLKKTGLIKEFTYIKENLLPSSCISHILKGRSIKYLFLERK
jgi:FkbM family methyltransferase